MASYTALATVSTGDPWTASDHNIHIKDNFTYFKDLTDDIQDGTIIIDWVFDTTPVAGGDVDLADKDLHNIKQVDFQEYHDAGTSGVAKTIDWNEGNKQKLQVTGNACDLSLTDPAGACALELRLIGDGTLRTNIDADHDADCGWVDGGEVGAYGSVDDEVIGTLFFTFDPSSTPKYLVSSVSKGA